MMLKEWLPADRPVKLSGLVHVVYEALSNWHWKVAPTSLLKAKVAEVELVGLAGLAVMVVTGGVVSRVMVAL